MIRNVLEHIHGIAAYPVVAFLLFLAVFIGIVVVAMRMRPGHIRHMSRLPLEQDGSTSQQGDH